MISFTSGYTVFMHRTPQSPYTSTRNYGTVIAVYTADSSIPLDQAFHQIATLIAAGTALRVGVIFSTPQPRIKQYQPAEGLLAACNGAAGRLMGAKPIRRVVNRPPGVDWFAPRLRDSLAQQDWFDIYQEARSSRGVLLLIDPADDIYRDITLRFGEHLLIDECGRKIEYPEAGENWTSIAITVLHTMLAVRTLFVPPCDAFGMEAIFGSPIS